MPKKPFSALRRCPCRDSTLRVLFRRHRRHDLCCYRNNFCRFAAFSGGFAANSAAIGGDIRGFSLKIRKNPRKKVL